MDATMNRAEMEQAFYGREASYDGLFFVAVTTTGVFCRPSCPARKPLPEHVQFFPSVKEALGSGYRPCKRCQPLATAGEHPEWVEQILRRLEERPDARWKDRDLRSLGVEPVRLRRYFRERFGMTFQAYARGRRLGRALEAIRRGDRLDDVVFDHGYDSHSGFRDAFSRLFGDAPGRARQADCVLLDWIESPLGPLVAGATGDGVCLLEFSDRRMLEAQLQAVKRRFGLALAPGQNSHLERLKSELAAYFGGAGRSFSVPLVYPGTPFQSRVWDALREIPYGETRSYAEMAERVGEPGAVRAVGRANGMNRIAIAIPCHRVVGSDGSLTGYGGGLHRKRLLLDLERGRPVPWCPRRLSA
jgi:AraC family transcriptional regulator of adaptative response/methylated-DNA-[protein]-cysteine methyltransferase